MLPDTLLLILSLVLFPFCSLYYSLVQSFSTGFERSIEGGSDTISMSELTGGAQNISKDFSWSDSHSN